MVIKSDNDPGYVVLYLTVGQVLKNAVRLNILGANIRKIKNITQTTVINIMFKNMQFINLTIRMLFIRSQSITFQNVC